MASTFRKSCHFLDTHPFGEETLFFSDSDDSLELHYIYFDVDKERKITSVRETSLSPVKKR